MPADPPSGPAYTSIRDDFEPTPSDVREVVRNAQAGSPQGPSGNPYKVYKNCQKLLKKLWNLIKIVCRKGTVPDCWKEAEGCLTPKEEKSENISQFRTISLMSVEGNIFF